MNLDARITALAQAIGADIKALFSGKVDQVSGKGLSANDYTTTDKTKLGGIAAGAQVNVATNLAVGGATGTTVSLTSSTGTGATLTGATSGAAGLMVSADKSKLDGVAVGAQVNAVTSVAGRAGAVVLAKGDVGLGSADNTADTAKQVSGPQQAALDLKAPVSQPNFLGPATSVLAQNAFRAQAPAGGSQTGMSLYIPDADTDRRVFEWLALHGASPRMTIRTINDAYSAGTEFFTAYRAASGHAMDRLSIKSLNMVVGQDAQINANYRIQSSGGISTTGPLLLGIFTLTTLPSAATYGGSYITVSNATGGAKLCYSNGTNWLIANTATIVS